MKYTMNAPMPELPYEPEYFPGSDEWTEMMDARRYINEQYQQDLAEDRD